MTARDELAAAIRATTPVFPSEPAARRELVDGDLRLIDAIVQAPTLSPSECRVAELVAEGLSNQEIAGELGVTLETVKTHVSQAIAKVRARNRTHLAAIYTRNVAA